MLAMSVLFTLSLLALPFFATSVDGSCQFDMLPSEAKILGYVKKDLEPYFSSVLSSWNYSKSSKCSDWLGICCNEKGYVTKIYLSTEYVARTSGGFSRPNIGQTDSPTGYPFQGILSPHFGSLASLDSLVLTGLALTGNIPPQLGNLKNLSIFNVSNNILYGPIPDKLQNWTSLRVFDVHANSNLDYEGNLLRSIAGPIPEWIGSLSRLVYIDLSQNNFSGNVPASLKKISTLKYLSFSDNYLFGEVGSFINGSAPLKFLDLSINDYFEDISVLEGLKMLEYLDLNSVSLTSFPDIDLPKLKFLNLAGNSLTEFPVRPGRFSTLTHLDLSANGLSGPVPAVLSTLLNLESLSLAENNLEGSLYFVKKLPNLKSLEININKFSGRIPDFNANSSKLNYLSLSNNFLVGGIPRGIANLTNLKALVLGNNNLSEGGLPLSFLALQELQQLDVSGNSLSGLINVFCKLKSLTLLIVKNNNFSGSVPDCFHNLDNIDYVDLSNNHFTGPFPPNLGESTVSELHVARNKIQGKIPQNIEDLPYLIALDVSNNKLSGPFPRFNFVSENVQYLDFSKNRFTGKVRMKLFGESICANIAYLNVTSNCLTTTGTCITQKQKSEYQCLVAVP